MLSKEPHYDMEVNEKVDELIQKAVEDKLAALESAEANQDQLVDEETR